MCPLWGWGWGRGRGWGMGTGMGTGTGSGRVREPGTGWCWVWVSQGGGGTPLGPPKVFTPHWGPKLSLSPPRGTEFEGIEGFEGSAECEGIW